MNTAQSPSRVLDPVAAYDRLAPLYAGLRASRCRYLDRIDRLVASGIAAGSRSLLDVGAGDGARAVRIAAEAGLQELVLLEPSTEMRNRIAAEMRATSVAAEIWPIRAEELSASGRSFDAITCLWNVLGHIRPAQARVQVLRRLGRLLSPTGVMFLDFNHRYNARSYGLAKTVSRYLYDHILPGADRGDVTVGWDLQGERCVTYGHVFTDREIGRLSRAAGLKIACRFVVDYDTGQIRRSPFRGNLLYKLFVRPDGGPERGTDRPAEPAGAVFRQKSGEGG